MRMPCALDPCKSLNNRIRCIHGCSIHSCCIHSRKSKATANHLCTLTNAYFFTEHTWLHNQNAAAAGATRCPNPQKLLQKTQSSTRIHTAIRATSRQFDTLRPHRQDTDRIQSRASHEFLPRFAPLCACAPPAAPTPAAFAQPPVSRDAPRIFLPNLTKSLVPALLPVNPSNRPKQASALNPI